jgi:hypothetical protein
MMTRLLVDNVALFGRCALYPPIGCIYPRICTDLTLAFSAARVAARGTLWPRFGGAFLLRLR